MAPWRAALLALVVLLAPRGWARERPQFTRMAGPLPVTGAFQGVAVTRSSRGVLLYLTDREQQGVLVGWRQGQARVVVLPPCAGRAGAEAGAAWADFDGDGDPDLLVTRYGAAALLYRNEGDTAFVETASACGLANRGASQGAAWADYDGDGDLDVYIVHQGEPNQLWRNDRGHFADVAVAAGVADGGPSMAAAWADYDRDGDLDLFLTRDGVPARLFSNDGRGRFTDVASAVGLADEGPAAGCAWVDYDADGDWDLSLTQHGAADRLYQYDAYAGRFADVAPQLGLDDPGRGRLAAWADYDRDGDLDVFVVNGGADGADVSRLYRNDGNRFVSAGVEAGLVDAGSGPRVSDRGAVWWDIDEDGDLDLLVVGEAGPVRVWENRGHSSVRRPGWLSVELRQRGRNAAGSGAEAVLWIHGASHLRHLGLAENYLSQGVSWAYWGLGRARPDSLVVTWPDGFQQRPSWGLDRHNLVVRPAPQLELTPASLALSTVAIDSPAVAVVQVRNTGHANLEILGLRAAPAVNPLLRISVLAQVDSTLTLPPGGRLPVPLVVTPLAAGPFTFRLVVQAATDTAELVVEGVATPAPQIRTATALGSPTARATADPQRVAPHASTPRAAAGRSSAEPRRRGAVVAKVTGDGAEDHAAASMDDPGPMAAAGQTPTHAAPSASAAAEAKLAAAASDRTPTATPRQGAMAAAGPIPGAATERTEDQPRSAAADPPPAAANSGPPASTADPGVVAGDGSARGAVSTTPSRVEPAATPALPVYRRGPFAAAAAGLAGIGLWIDGERGLTTSYRRYQRSRVPERSAAYWDAAHRAQHQRTLGQVSLAAAVGYLGFRGWRGALRGSAPATGQQCRSATRTWACWPAPNGIWLEWGW